MASRFVYIGEIIDNRLGDKVIAKLIELDGESHSPIVMPITSYGGNLSVGEAICEVIDTLRSPVYTLGIGYAMSAGAMILTAGAPGHRYVEEETRIMIHQPSTIAELKRPRLDMLHYIKDSATERLAANMGKTYREIYNYCERDYYMGAEEAIELGIADKIIGTGADAMNASIRI